MYSYLLSPLILQVENPRQVFRPTLSSQATVGFGLPSMLRPKIDKQRLWPGAACYPSSSSRVTVGFTSACAGSQTPSGSGQHVQAARLRVATQKLVCQSSQQIAVENWRSLPKESMSASLVSCGDASTHIWRRPGFASMIPASANNLSKHARQLRVAEPRHLRSLDLVEGGVV